MGIREDSRHACSDEVMRPFGAFEVDENVNGKADLLKSKTDMSSGNIVLHPLLDGNTTGVPQASKRKFLVENYRLLTGDPCTRRTRGDEPTYDKNTFCVSVARGLRGRVR